MTTSGRFRVYSASAGSGKTFQLTVEYLKFALRNPEVNYRRILAITFTRKATKEMKSRILEACKAFADAKEKPLSGRNRSLFEAIQKETEYTDEEIIKKSRIVYRHILHNYSDFAVSTIDSFTQRVTRAFAYELKIPLNYEVQLNTDETLNVLTDRLMSMVGEDEIVTRLVEPEFKYRLEIENSTQIRQEIFKAAKSITKDESKQYIDKLSQYPPEEIERIGQKIFQRTRAMAKDCTALAQKALDVIHSEGLEVEDFSGKGRAFPNTFRKAINQKFEHNLTFVNSILGDKDWFAAKSTKSISHDAETEIRQIGAQLIQLIDAHNTIYAIHKNYPKLATLSYLYRLYKEYQKEEDIVLISETNQLISEQVKSQPAPFIYEKIGEQYTYFLVDEFQDTSVMQWHNMVPLISESLMQPQGESLVVGDGKQSIYRFRGGETRQLSELPKLVKKNDNPYFSEYENILGQHFDKINLEYNYRSREEIINFNNSLYDYIHELTELEDIHPVYENSSQRIQNLGSGGYVKVNCLKPPVQGQRDAFLDERYPIIIDTINDILSRGYKYSDIAILTKNNKDLSIAAEYLAAANIPSIGTDSLAISNDIIVTTFPIFYELFLHQNDQVTQLTLATRLQQIGMIDVDLHTLNKGIADAKCTTIEDFNQFLQQYNADIDIEKLYNLPILDAWEQYLHLVDNQYIRPAYTGCFRENLFQFVSLFGNDFENLLLWWDDKSYKMFIEAGDNIDGVKLSTIHKSKGLEYEIVIMPTTRWKLKKEEEEWINIEHEVFSPMDALYLNVNSDVAKLPDPFQSVYQEKLRKVFLDNLNTLYVATTRPVAELYIFTDYVKPKKDPMYEMSRIAYYLSRYAETKSDVVDDTVTFSLGKKTNPEYEEKRAKINLKLKIKEENQSANITIKPRSSTIWNDEIKDKIEKGTIIHSILESVRVPEDIEMAVQNAIIYGWLQKEDKEFFIQNIKELVQHPEVSDFFSATANVVSEQTIIDELGHEYIPDRLHFVGKNVDILDFKSGKYSTKHDKQLNKYAEVLTKMGYSVQSKIIVLTAPIEVIRVE